MANTGVVACKLPNGLTIDHEGQSLTLNGSDNPNSVRGYGLTSNVDIDWFNDWMTGPARDFPPVRLGLIFVQGNEANAAAQAREQGNDIQSGLEGLDPEDPGKGSAEFAGKVEPTDEQRRETAKARAAKPE